MNNVITVRSDAELEDRLRKGGEAAFQTFLRGASLEKYWRLVVAGLRDTHRMGEAFADLPRVLSGFACADLRRVAWVDPAGPFYDDTPGSGHPVRYDALAADDPLYVACSGGRLRDML